MSIWLIMAPGFRGEVLEGSWFILEFFSLCTYLLPVGVSAVSGPVLSPSLGNSECRESPALSVGQQEDRKQGG